MGIANTMNAFCRALLVAASMTALAVATAQAQDNEPLHDQILANPQNAELNLRYAREAETRGELRLALAAYERVLINEPDNAEARRGYERVRRALEPPFTIFRTELGARWDSNPLNAGFGETEAESFYTRLMLVDERPIAGRRWRSIANFHGEITPDIDQLDYAFLGVQTGPLFYKAPHKAAIPAIGLGVATLDGSHYFNEYNLGLTFEGRKNGLSWWTRLRGGVRDYSYDATAEEGPYAELAGGLTAPRLTSDNDALVIAPWVRWSDIEGESIGFFFDANAPGQFIEYGLEAHYHNQVADHVLISVGATARQRDYDRTTVGPSKREDFYFAPGASLTLNHLTACSCSLRLSYEHRRNDSNDPASDFDANQVSLSLMRQF